MRCFSPICSWLPSITKNSLKEQGNNLKPFAVVPPPLWGGKCKYW